MTEARKWWVKAAENGDGVHSNLGRRKIVEGGLKKFNVKL